jgi:O-succinylbenzoate synthase
VGLKVGENVLLALWDEEASKNRSEEIAVVVSDKELASKILEYLKLHEQVSQSPGRIEQLPGISKENFDPAPRMLKGLLNAAW